MTTPSVNLSMSIKPPPPSDRHANSPTLFREDPIFVDHGIDIDYDRFVDTIEMYFSLNLVPPQFGGTMIPVTLTEIAEKDKEHGGQHFTIVLDKATIDAQDAA
jgi:hypothetical protein